MFKSLVVATAHRDTNGSDAFKKGSACLLLLFMSDTGEEQIDAWLHQNNFRISYPKVETSSNISRNQRTLAIARSYTASMTRAAGQLHHSRFCFDHSWIGPKDDFCRPGRPVDGPVGPGLYVPRPRACAAKGLFGRVERPGAAFGHGALDHPALRLPGLSVSACSHTVTCAPSLSWMPFWGR
jgi:hypothetical protein